LTSPLVRFQVQDLSLALPLQAVAGVAEPAPVSPLPGTPPAVVGAATIGGSVLIIFDLEPLLSPPAVPAAVPPPGQAFLVLDGLAAGFALRLPAPPTCAPAGQRESAPAAAAASLCSHGDRTPDGTLSGVLDPSLLLGALGGPAAGR
jgi:purine-binding chemotaxis protein CheW